MTPIYERKYRRAVADRKGRAYRLLSLAGMEFKRRIRSVWVIIILVVLGLQIFGFLVGAVFDTMFLVSQPGVEMEGSISELLVRPGGPALATINGNGTIIMDVEVENIGDVKAKCHIDVMPHYRSENWTAVPLQTEMEVGQGATETVSIYVEHLSDAEESFFFAVMVEIFEAYEMGGMVNMGVTASNEDLPSAPEITASEQWTLTAGSSKDFSFTVTNKNSRDFVLTNYEVFVFHGVGLDQYDYYGEPIVNKDDIDQMVIPAGESVVFNHTLSASHWTVARTSIAQFYFSGYYEDDDSQMLFNTTFFELETKMGEKTDYFNNRFFELTSGGNNYVFTVLLAAIAGGAVISEDLRTKAITLMLSRPIRRVDYLLAKFLSVFFVVSIFTVGVYSVTFFIVLLMSTVSFDFFFSHIWILGSVLLKGIITAFFYSTVVLFFSSVTDKKWLASIAAIGTFFISSIFSGIIGIFVRKPWTHMVSLEANLNQLSSYLFNVPAPFDYPWYHSLMLITALSALLITAMYLRIKGVEFSE